MEISEKKTGKMTIIGFQGELMGGDEVQLFQKKIYDIVQSENLYVILDMKDVKWKEIPPVRGPNPQGLKKPTEVRKVLKRHQAKRIFP